MAVKNPLAAVFTTMLWALLWSALLSIPLLIFKWLAFAPEISVIYGVAAFAIAGALAGRSGTFALAAFPVSFLGAFLGYMLFNAIASPPASLLFATIHGVIAGLAAWATATAKMAKVRSIVTIENEDKRQCRMCGARVGTHARRCWRCRASLNRIT
ncbi:MAG TPA: hypothetical protein VGR51_09730 [Thermoplasmata archaeon]|nr:hypothetical protein [Thermoplasmata archaeon]